METVRVAFVMKILISYNKNIGRETSKSVKISEVGVMMAAAIKITT